MSGHRLFRSAGMSAAGCLLTAVLTASPAAAAQPDARDKPDVRQAEHLYSAGLFQKALAEYSALSAANPGDAHLRQRLLQCKLAAGTATPAEEKELRSLREAWSRDVAGRLGGIRESALKAQELARSGKGEAAMRMIASAEAELNALARDVDVTALRRQLADAVTVVRTARPAADDRAAAADRPAGDEAFPGRGRHRLVKDGDKYVIVAAVEPMAAAVPPAPVAPAPVAPAAAPPPPVALPLPFDVVPRPIPLAAPRVGFRREDVIWNYGDYVDLPAAVRADVLTAQRYLRQAPKYHYERILAFQAEQANAAALVQMKAEAIFPMLNYQGVAQLPPCVNFRAPSPDDAGLNLGAHADGTETVAYDLSFLALSDGPFDGLSYSRYLFNGHEGEFIQGLTNPGVPFYSPTFVGGGFGGGAAPGRGGWGGGFGGFPNSRSQIYGGNPADFAAGHPYVLNYMYNNMFGYRDPVQTAQLMNTLNALVRDPALAPARPAQPRPAQVPTPAP